MGGVLCCIKHSILEKGTYLQRNDERKEADNESNWMENKGQIHS